MFIIRRIYTERLERAVQQTVLHHRNQIRRTPNRLPYVSHLISVLVMLLQYTRDEDVLIAGLLHDAIEDTDCTYDDISSLFGEKVATIVSEVSEEKERGGEELSWKERKLGYIENIQNNSQEAMIVCAVDKIYNLRALQRDYETYGDSMWDFISPGIAEKLWYHDEIVRVLSPKMKHRRLFRDLVREVNKTKKVFNLGRSSYKLPFIPYSGRILWYGNRNTR